MKNITNNLTAWLTSSLLLIGILFSGNAISDNHIGLVIHANGAIVATNDGSQRKLTRGSTFQ